MAHEKKGGEKMKKDKRILLLSALLMLTLLISNGATTKTEAADKPKSVTTIVWGTSSLGSTGQMVGSAIGSVINNNEPSLKVSVQATGGATENPRLLTRKQIDIAHVNNPYDAAHSLGTYKGEPPVQLWALFQMYSNEYIICVLEDSPIKSIKDLVGKKVSTGPPGSGTKLMSETVLKAYGMYDKIKASYLGYNESVDALKDGVVDAIAQYTSVGITNPSLEQLNQTTKFRVLPMDNDILQSAYDTNPDYAPITIPANSISAIKKDFLTLASFSTEFADSRMSDEVAYTIVKTIYEHLPELGKYHQLAGRMSVKTGLIGVPKGMPVHPGAAKYYKEKGAWRNDLIVGVRK
jgi:uncharacterized protein